MLVKYKSATVGGSEDRLLCSFSTCAVTTWGLAPGKSASKSKHTSETKTERKFHHCQLSLRKPLPLLTILESKHWWQTLSICLYAVDVHRNTPTSVRLSHWGGCCHLAMAIWKQQFLIGIVLTFDVEETSDFWNATGVHWSSHTTKAMFLPWKFCRERLCFSKCLYPAQLLSCDLRDFRRLQVAVAEGPLTFCISRSRWRTSAN